MVLPLLLLTVFIRLMGLVYYMVDLYYMVYVYYRAYVLP